MKIHSIPNADNLKKSINGEIKSKYNNKKLIKHYLKFALVIFCPCTN